MSGQVKILSGFVFVFKEILLFWSNPIYWLPLNVMFRLFLSLSLWGLFLHSYNFVCVLTLLEHCISRVTGMGLVLTLTIGIM